jgi:hypothetical protein
LSSRRPNGLRFTTSPNPATKILVPRFRHSP